MLDEPDAQKKESPQSSEEIQIPPISKQTAGAVAGAALGSVAGPIGAVVGGVVGALAGKASATGRRIVPPAAKKTVKRVVRKAQTAAKPVGKSRRAKKASRSAKGRKASRG